MLFAARAVAPHPALRREAFMSQTQVPGAPSKVCVLCKQDVSKKPRVKDPQGRYLCEPCFKQAEARSAAPKAPQAPQPKAAAARQAAPAREMAGAGGGGGEEVIFDAIDQGDAGLGDVMLPEGYDPAMALAAVKAQPEAPVRVHQPKTEGKDGKKGKNKGKPAPGFACRHCGYDMAGAISTRCPECGKVNMQPKDQGLVDDEREIRRNVYRRPFILMLIGWVLSAAVLAFSKAGVSEVVGLVVLWGIVTVFGVFTFWVCTKMFLEYDAPWHITLLRLAGIFACTTVLPTSIGFASGLGMVFGLAAIGLTVLLYMTELELELWEAIGLAIAGWVIVRVATLVIAVLMLRGMVGGGGGGAGGGTTTVVPSTPALVSPSDPSGTVYYDANTDGVDDDTGNPVPKDAVPIDEAPMDGGGDGEEDGGE